MTPSSCLFPSLSCLPSLIPRPTKFHLAAHRPYPASLPESIRRLFLPPIALTKSPIPPCRIPASHCDSDANLPSSCKSHLDLPIESPEFPPSSLQSLSLPPFPRPQRLASRRLLLHPHLQPNSSRRLDEFCPRPTKLQPPTEFISVGSKTSNSHDTRTSPPAVPSNSPSMVNSSLLPAPLSPTFRSAEFLHHPREFMSSHPAPAPCHRRICAQPEPSCDRSIG